MINVEECGYFRSNEFYHSEVTPERTTVFFEAELIISKGAISYIDNVGYPHMKGRVIFAKPGQKRFTAGKFESFFLKFTTNDPHLDNILKTIPNSFIIKDYNVLQQKIESLTPSNDNMNVSLKLNEKVYSILNILFDASVLSNESYSVHTDKYYQNILKAKEFIDKCYCQKINLDILASKAYLSKNFFRIKFIELIGISPNNYLKNVRISNAKNLLKATKIPISEIAVECGFESQAYMNYVFKKELNITPLEYRKKNYKKSMKRQNTF